MITDDELRQKEAEVESLFGGGSPWTDKVAEAGTEERVRKIMHRVKLESLAKDSVSFIFKSFGATLGGVAQALFKALPESSQGPDEPEGDDRPSESRSPKD